MKRSELKRKTPLKSRGPTERKSALSAGRPMQRKPMARRTKPRRQAASDSRWRSEAYLRWVRTLPCCVCGAPADSAHHLIGMWQVSGMGLKAPDSLVMPVCDGPGGCHQAIHASPEMQARQPGWLTDTINHGLDHFTDEPIVGALADALEFIAAKEDAHG